MTAVTQNCLSLEHVHIQTPEICLRAVMQNGYALKYVRVQTPEICLAAVRAHRAAFEYVKDKESLRKYGFLAKIFHNDIKFDIYERCIICYDDSACAKVCCKQPICAFCYAKIKRCPICKI